jgi:DNA repair exonuclease SbcCD nuclease subunit
MKIGIFSDAHMRLGGKKMGGIWDKRLVDGLAVLEKIVHEMKGVDAFIFCGDMFDRRYTTDFKVVAGISEILQGLDAPGWFIVGNHDQYRDTITSLNMFSMRPGWHVVNSIERVDIGGKSFVMAPYHKDAAEILKHKEVQEGADVLVLHQMLAGHMYGASDLMVFGTEVFDWKNVKNFDWVISGHNHVVDRDNENGVISLGSMMQLCFADEGYERGCWIYDGGFKFIPIDGPKYFTVGKVEEVKTTNDYYRLSIPENQFVGNVPENVSVQVIAADVGCDRLQLGARWDWEDVLGKYVEKHVSDADKTPYLDAGLTMLKEVGNGRD